MANRNIDPDAWKDLVNAAKEYDEWNRKQQRNINTLAGHTHSLPSPTTRGRPVGSKTKDKEVIIQETVDRLIEHVVRLLTKYNYGEEHLSDAEIVVDEKANYAFITVTVGLPNGSIISVSERVKVANKTDPKKNWTKLNTTAYGIAPITINAILYDHDK